MDKSLPLCPIAVVVVGHVDHGKSTLIGRLFHDAGVLPEGRFDQLTAAAERRGAAFEFANFTDGLQAERDQNVTIDTTQILFRSNGREILFIDAPGHREFIKNMVTGAAQADAALLVIDAVDGVSDQTRRHALLLTILGITRLIVVINKIDRIAESERQARFSALAAAATDVLGSLGLAPASIVPAAASLGWNVINRAAEIAWHQGATVVEALFDLAPARTRSHLPAPARTCSHLPAPDRTGSHLSAPARTCAVFSVQDVYRRDARRWLVGRLESGSLSPGDAVVVLPSGQPATVDLVEFGAADPQVRTPAFTIREPLFVARGDVLASPDAGLVVATTLHARIFWLGREPMTADRRYEMRLGTQHTDAEVVAITRVIDASALAERTDCSCVPAHDVADVELRLSRPLVVAPSLALAAGGRATALARLVIVDRLPQPDIVGGGIVLSTTPAMARAAAAATEARVSADERRVRQGHRGAVVWLTGLSGSGKSTLANGLERTLFDRGLQVTVLDGDRVRFGLNADLGFSQEDRRENIRRIAEVAKLFAESGVIAITSFISPYAADRERARDIVSTDASGAGLPFIEVFVEADLSVCEARDPKGLYRKARAGDIAEFTGISAPYEMPAHAELVIRTAECTPEEGVAQLAELVLGAVRS